MRYFWWIVLLLGFGQGCQNVLAETDHLTQLGRSIYERGLGRDGREIAAKIHGSVSLIGAAVACVGCHGRDGSGGGEAFIRAPDIRWVNLNQPYPARRAGTAEASYDRSTFKKALHTGIAASGRKLDPAMPRFDLADDEIDALISFLDQIDRKPNNASSSPIILGLLPTPGQNLLTDTLDSGLRNCAMVKSGGPIATIDILYFDSPDAAITQLNNRLKTKALTIILAPYLIGWEERYAEAVRSSPVKTILPFTFLDRIDASWYFPFPGIEAQIMALLKLIQIDGYQQLYIAYDPEDPLSARLQVFTMEIAAAYGISLVVNKKLEESTKSSRSAILWLKPVPKELPVGEIGAQFMMLAPVLFFSPNLIVSHETEWRVAYPYQPKSRENSLWRKPVNVWTQAACKFLEQIGAKKIKLDKLPEVFSWEEHAYLYQNPSLGELSKQVIVETIITSSWP